MSSVNKTPHYNLSQFGDSPDDKPSWRGDYTGDMSKIDSQMYRNEADATTATSTANSAKTTADGALSLAQTNKAGIAEQESYFNALGVTSAQTAQALMSTINGKAENTDLTALRGRVSSLYSTVGGKADSSAVYTRGQSDVTFVKQGGYSGTAQQLNQLISTNTADISALEAWRAAWLNGWKMGTVSHSESSGVSVVGNNTLMKFMYNETVGAFKFLEPFLRVDLTKPALILRFRHSFRNP